MDLHLFDTPGKIQQQLYAAEEAKKTLFERRRVFMSRCANAFSNPPMVIELAGQREMVWRKRTAVTGGPQSTVEFHTKAGQRFLASLPAHVLERYVELDAERIRLNMQIRITTALVLSLRQYLMKHRASRVFASAGVDNG